MGSVPAHRPVRSDALRNRARLIDVAAQAFRDEGLDFGVDEIARRAGVGTATLYRHFPAKPDLILAVVETVLDEFRATVAMTVERVEPADALARFLAAALEHQRRNRGLLEALGQRGLPDDVRARFAAHVVATLEPIVAVARRAGTLGSDLDATDLLVVVRLLGVVAREPDPERYLRVLERGLAPG